MGDEPMAEVISLFPTPPTIDDALVRSEPRPRGADWCAHKRTLLNTESRRVTCKDCEREVDAFDALLEFASNYEHWLFQRDYAEGQAKREETRLIDLKRQVRNAQAQLRRLR